MERIPAGEAIDGISPTIIIIAGNQMMPTRALVRACSPKAFTAWRM
jgi:hypothetical protein